MDYILHDNWKLILNLLSKLFHKRTDSNINESLYITIHESVSRNSDITHIKVYGM